MVTVSGYTIWEIRNRAGVSGAKVRQWAKQYTWPFTRIGLVKIYHPQDVDDFFAARLRRDLMKAAGWTGSAKLIWSDTWDMDCPRCEGFAVEKPAKPGETQTAEWLSGEVDICCVNCGLMPQKVKRLPAGAQLAD